MNIAIQTSGVWMDITPQIALGGVTWKRNDIDGPNSGRTITGTMERDRVTTKIRLDVTCILLDEYTLKNILQLIYPEYIYVRYDDPQMGQRTVWMYSNNNPATISHYDTQGNLVWKEVTFPLIEV